MRSPFDEDARLARTFVAIDGGKSGVRVTVRSASGCAYGQTQGTFHADGANEVDAIIAAVDEALADCGPYDRPTAVCAGLTGYPDAPAIRAHLRNRLASLTGTPNVIVVEDCVTAHVGALGSAGTVVSAGTGTVVLGIGAAYDTERRDGWGPLLGDRGSGFAIGRAGLKAAWSARDGVGPRTGLTERARAFLGGDELRDVQRFYTAPALFTCVSDFATWVFDAAREHDEVATAIVHRAVADLTDSVVSAARSLADEPDAVSYAGRLFDAGAALLEPFADGLRRHGLRLQEPAGNALAGAMRIAMAAGPDRPDFGIYGSLIATTADTGDVS